MEETSLDDLLEEAKTELPLCPHCKGSSKQRWLESRRFRVKIQVSEVYPGGEVGLQQKETIVAGNLSLDDICQLGEPNVPPLAHVIPTTEW
jgi:hypothetical protein